MAITTDSDLRRGIGCCVAETRDYRGLTQEQLANRIGVPLAAIAALEQGLRFPRFRTLLALSRELRVPIRDILDEQSLTGGIHDDRLRLERRGRTMLHDLSDELLAVAVEQLSAFANARPSVRIEQRADADLARAERSTPPTWHVNQAHAHRHERRSGRVGLAAGGET